MWDDFKAHANEMQNMAVKHGSNRSKFDLWFRWSSQVVYDEIYKIIFWFCGLYVFPHIGNPVVDTRVSIFDRSASEIGKFPVWFQIIIQLVLGIP